MKSPSPTEDKNCYLLLRRAVQYVIGGSPPEVAFKRAVSDLSRSVPGCYDVFLEVLRHLPCVWKKYPLLDLGSSEAISKALECKEEVCLPNWIYQRLIRLLGEQGIRNLHRRRKWVRINTLKIDEEEAVNLMTRKGYSFERDKDFPYLLEWRTPHVISTPEYSSGVLIPHDKATSYVVQVLDPKPGEIVLELGGSPGVKTSLIQQMTRNSSFVISVDISAKRLELQRQLMKKWGVENVQLVNADGAKMWVRRVHKVLIDAPCTNSGTINADPSLPIRLRKRELLNLVRIQERILSEAIKLGVPVVYSTCSLFPEEGELQVERYSRYLVKIAEDPSFLGYRRSKVWLRVMRTYPHVHYTEGFFIAKLNPQ
ncbi:RsmB/NOP family class I SAM-dependent RNA methyltransferase [Metallosphaera tengchongensis]|uniref:RsmB/NOP family class I SAM-dependent RNA methyltransferase n=2 Tax=Metallosphaera tengchongensis TaxID=1532350 RepID=A0A6N0NZ39_9CREN|nr:RsmB/NOP family class I SAM-dependent RNA methyltransferase [Metallosphaera tengchongensis]